MTEPGFKKTENILLVIILLFAAVLRIYDFWNFSFSNDELSALSRLRFETFRELLDKGIRIDGHPAGTQTLLFYWTHIFGISEFSVRLPFVLFGIASVYLLFALGKHWFNSSAGLFAAAALAILEYPILFSRIARPYSMGLFFTLLAACFWTKIFFNRIEGRTEEKVNPKQYVGFIFSISACMYTHYFAFMQAGLIYIAGFFFLSKENYKPYFISGLFLPLLYVPHLHVFQHQLSLEGIGGATGWLGKPGSDFLWKYIQQAFNNSTFLLLFFLLILIFSFVLFTYRRQKNKFRLLALLFFILPFLIGYFYSLYRNPVLQNSVLLFAFPFFVLLIFSFIPSGIKKKWLIVGIFIILVSGSYSTAFQNKFYSINHFAVFKEIAQTIIKWNKQYGEQNITRTINIHNPYYINYYFEKYNSPGRFEQYLCYEYSMMNDFIKIVDSSATPYFLHAWSNIYDLPEIEEVIKQKYPYIAGRENYFQSQVTFYSKNKMESFKEEKPVFEIIHDFEKPKWANDSAFRDSAKAYSGKFAAFMDSTKEYSPSFSASVNNLNLKEGGIIKMEINVYSQKTALKAKMVISIDDAEKNIYWSGSEMGNFITYENKWQKLFMVRNIDIPLKGHEVVKAFIWNDKKESFLIDDFKIRVFKN